FRGMISRKAREPAPLTSLSAEDACGARGGDAAHGSVGVVRLRVPLVFHDARKPAAGHGDRKSTRLNSSHVKSSYTVVCVKKEDLELRRRALLDDGVGGDALFLGALEDVLQAVDVFVEVVDQVDLGRMRAFAGGRRAWRLR